MLDLTSSAVTLFGEDINSTSLLEIKESNSMRGNAFMNLSE